MTSFGQGTPITSRALNTAFAEIEAQIVSGVAAAGSLTGTTLASNVVNSSLTSVGTLASGSIPASLLTGTTLPATIVTSSLTSVGTLASGSIPTTLLTGIVASAQLSGSYTGITGVGTLAAGSIPATLLTGIVADARISGNYTGFTGITSSGRIHAQTDLRVGNANSAVLSSNQFRLIVTPQAYTSYGVEIGEFYSSSGIYSASSNFNIGASTTTSFINPANGNTAAYITNVDGEYYGRSNIRIFTAGANFIAQSPTTSSGNAAQWLSVFGLYILIRNTSTRNDKENFQPLNGIVTASMIDDIEISLWNRKGATGFPEIGPMAEDMDEVSPFLSIRGMDCDDEGNIVATEPTGINQNSWLSLLTLSVQDIRTRLAELESR
jgi:hypothetical protein